MSDDRSVLLESWGRHRDGASWLFTGLKREITAATPADVLPALREVEEAVEQGCHAAGFLSYEAAAGLDAELPGAAGGPLPLLWFGIFTTKAAVASVHGATPPGRTGGWRSSLSPQGHAEAVSHTREYIAAGDVYQVNLTMRRHFRFTGSPFGFYRQLCRAQQAAYCAFLDLGRYQVLSASPELFFKLRDGQLTVRPMKGTAPRGRWWQEDEENREKLRRNQKERAENLMIVDLLRNDLGKVARTGSVAVESLFQIETLPTLHQMTSTITAQIHQETSLSAILRALFPCGSVTGAPKKRAMEIIGELEGAPRGVYTGCIGYVSPGTAAAPASCEAVFSVAIRTVVLDMATGKGELGIGSGITWDSRAGAEYTECLAKGGFAEARSRRFRLIETMLFEEGEGYFLLERHLTRLCSSAAFFGFTLDQDRVRRALAGRAILFTGNQKVRLLLSPQGRLRIEHEPIHADPPGAVFPATIAATQVRSGDPFLYHKTTSRTLFRKERARMPDGAEPIFTNERGEITEGSTATVVARIAGELVTPSLGCGLLPGVFRQELLEQNTIREQVITRRELEQSEEIYLVNSVRKWRRAKLLQG